MLAACKIVGEIAPSPDIENVSNSISSRVSNHVILQNGRLVFANSDIFMNVLNNLAQNPTKIDSLENTFSSYTSWRKYNEQNASDSTSELLHLCDDCRDLPSFFTALINQKKEFQIGDIIVFIENGKAYEIPAQQENSLKINGKFDVSLLSGVPNSPIENIGVETDEFQRNFIDAKYQYQYRFGNHTFRQTFEIVALKFKRPGSKEDPTYVTKLFLRMKLEYLKRTRWGRLKWRPAGENRVTFVDAFNGFSQYDTFSFSLRYHNINQPYTTSNRDTEFLLNTVEGSNNTIDAKRWVYNLKSYLMHLYVPSHGQGTSLVYVGGRGLYVPDANWFKFNP